MKDPEHILYRKNPEFPMIFQLFDFLVNIIQISADLLDIFQMGKGVITFLETSQSYSGRKNKILNFWKQTLIEEVSN